MENVLSKKLEGTLKNGSVEEGPVAKGIEKQTAKIPSDVFLWAALGSMASSLILKIAGKKHNALFVGQWAAPFLLLGVYNKLVKLSGHDKKNPDPGQEDWQQKDGEQH
jgi:hypothetical protein